MNPAELWEIERRLWLEGVTVYETHMDPACVMVFPGAGIMRAAEALLGLQGAPRWDSVEMTERVTGEGRDGVVVLAYRATGQRSGADPYEVFCTSTYRSDAGTWKLLQHQQTLAG
jgi:hypothetical protein